LQFAKLFQEWFLVILSFIDEVFDIKPSAHIINGHTPFLSLSLPVFFLNELLKDSNKEIKESFSDLLHFNLSQFALTSSLLFLS
jgi:hypothetical protein